MTTLHKILLITDFIALTTDEMERMIPDLLLWHRIAKIVPPSFAASSFDWCDDGRPGELHSVILLDGGKVFDTFEGPAFFDGDA